MPDMTPLPQPGDPTYLDCPPITPLHISRLIPADPNNPPRTPLVLLHGFTGDATTWSDLVPYLDPHRPAFAVDLVGHGLSDAPDDPRAYAMDAAVASVLAATVCAGIGRAHWLGYSMGGRVALHLALAAPERVASLHLIGASPGIDEPAARAARAAEDAALADFIETAGLEAFVERWMAHPLFASQARLGPERLARARAQRLRNRPHALARTLRGMGTGTMEPLWDRLGEIHAPVLLVAGEADVKFRAIAEAMRARLPRAEVHIAPGADHAVQVEAPEDLGAAVRAFLARVDPV
jgi:2-succinyl-6-hydroxy-2,4-cyclohexadiene-1-carboxylate synthase